MSDEPPSCDVVREPAWDGAAIDAEATSRACTDAVCRRLGVDPAGVEVGVRFTDDATIAALNATWRGVAGATDVLSFPAEEFGAPPALFGPPRLLGDVVIASETCRRDAAELARPLADHVRHLLVHGLLHLFHYDHQGADEAAVMEALEIAILADLGVADPYAGRPLAEESPR